MNISNFRINIVTILLPVTVSTIYTTKSCTKNLAKIRHKNATCASHLLIFAQPVAIWRGLQGGIIVCEKKKTTPRRTPGLSVQLRCVVWKGLNPPRAQGQARLPQTKQIYNEKLKISKAKTF